MPAPSYTYSLSNGSTADASQVMQNFNDILNGVSDGTKNLSISALTCAGTTTLNGAINLGSASDDDITVLGSLASSIPIKTTNTYNIGSSTLGLASVYFGANSQTVRLLGSSSMSATWTMTLPVSAGRAYDVLKNDGSGVTSWFGMNSGLITTTNTNITLTIADARHITYNSFSASRDVTLPTTSVLAGDVWVLANTTAYDMVVKASGGNALTIANSTNMDATVQNGYVRVQALQDTPTAATHWRVLEVYEAGVTTASTWTFNGSGGTSGSSDIITSRYNKEITVRLQSNAILATTGTNSESLINNTAIPTRFRAGHIHGWYAFVRVNTNRGLHGMIISKTNGTFELKRDSISSYWSDASINCGFETQTAEYVTYHYIQ